MRFLEFGYGRDDFFGKGFERRNFVNIRHIEYRVGESYLRKILDTTDDAIYRIIPGEVDSPEGGLLYGVVIASQRLAMFFEGVECFLHIFSTDPISNVAGIRVLSHHAQGLLRACPANQDAGMRV